MARLGSIIQSVYAATDDKPKRSEGDVQASRSDSMEFSSVDRTSASSSSDCAKLEEEAKSSASSPRRCFSGSEGFEERSNSSSSSSHVLSPLGWPLKQEIIQAQPLSKPKDAVLMWEEKREKRETEASEVEQMKERFARLLLGEDMSGGSRGVSTALAICNAITNLSASVFGELWRLEPLAPEKKKMWRREMEWLLSVTDHIVELIPTWQTCSDGTSVEVMVSNPRADLHINLPALRKLDMMLLECLDGFGETEFWYVDQGLAVSEMEDGKGSLPRQEDKWWLPTPRVPPQGLSAETRKFLQHQKEGVNQILKASMAINAQLLSEMAVPEVYWEALPKNGRSSLGEGFYRCLSFESFSAEKLLSGLKLTSEHNALEIANRLEAAIHAWKRKIKQQQNNKDSKAVSKSSSWGGRMKDLVIDSERRELLIGRAESLLLCLKQKFPGLPQTLLDIHKIQYNKDVGQSILESYSRVLESLAFSIISRLDDVLHMDELAKASPQADIHVRTLPLTRVSNTGSSKPQAAPSVEETPRRKHAPKALEVNTSFSYARKLEHGNALHSPPGRD